MDCITFGWGLVFYGYVGGHIFGARGLGQNGIGKEVGA